MIKLDDERKRTLEMKFWHIPDRDLIQELVRRGRFRQLQASALFYPEMRDESGYMDVIRSHVLHHLSKGLIDSDITPSVLQEYRSPTNEKQSVLTADVIVLCSRDPKVEQS